MSKTDKETDRKTLNENIRTILSFLLSINQINLEQFNDMKYLIRDLEDENEDEVMKIISPLLDNILVLENKEILINNKSKFLEALALVFPNKAEYWKALVKTEIIRSLSQKQNEVKALLENVLKLSAQFNFSFSNLDFKRWKILVDNSNENSIDDIHSLLIDKFNGLGYSQMQQYAPSVLAHIKKYFPEKFNIISNQYINHIK